METPRQKTWFAAALLSAATHGLVFLVMSDLHPREAIARNIVAMRIAETPPTPPPVEPPPVVVEEKKKIEPPIKRDKKIVEQPVTPVAEVTKPEAQPEATTTTPQPENAIPMPGPAEPVNGTGVVAGNGAMLGDGSGTPNVVRKAALGDVDRAGAATRSAAAKDALRGYHRGLFGALNGGLRYPPAARRLGIEGRVVLELRIDKQGQLVKKPIVVESSTSDLLDEAAIKHAEERAPYPVLPSDYEKNEAIFRVPVRFTLEG